MADSMIMETTVPAHVLEELADTLWQERHMVELLLFKMVTAKLLLAADEHRFVSPAIDEIEQVVASLRGAEQRRMRAIQAAADHWRIPVEDLTLAELANRSPSPMNRVFADHRDAFLRMTGEIEDTAATNRHLASSALGRVQASLDALAGVNGTTIYNAFGRTDAALTAPTRLDQSL